MSDDPRLTYGQWRLADADSRVRYQHEFSLAGIKTLVLMNGGAIIALLTYLGNSHDKLPATRLQGAFVLYVIGLVTVILAYLFAYLSQGQALSATMIDGLRQLGLIPADDKRIEDAKKAETKAGILIASAVLMVVASLAAFIGGSWCAMQALT